MKSVLFSYNEMYVTNARAHCENESFECNQRCCNCRHFQDVDVVVTANDAEVTPSAPEAVHTEVEADETAHDLMHTEPEPSQSYQLASSSEVIVDSDSVYSVCCSDVTTDTADIVHVDHETPPVAGRGTAQLSSSHLL